MLVSWAQLLLPRSTALKMLFLRPRPKKRPRSRTRPSPSAAERALVLAKANEFERRYSATVERFGFSTEALGLPSDWHRDGELSWGADTRRCLRHIVSSRAPDIKLFQAFLRCRLCEDGSPVLHKLGRASSEGDGWYRMPFNDGQPRELPQTENWSRAWHGCKLEGLYSTLYHGQLIESRDPRRLVNNKRGVYCFPDTLWYKALFYARFVPLCIDGNFWAATLELLVDPSQKVPAPTKQHIYKSSGVKIAALWVCGRTPDEMENQARVAREWKPQREANPQSFSVWLQLHT